MDADNLSNGKNNQHLSLKVQGYLWQQVSNSLKVKLQASKYEQTCVAFERLCRDRIKELKLSNDEVYKDIKSISRSTFIQGAFPYVIHCCAAILEQRRHLGLTDKLSVAVTKVFSTLHWILLESTEESVDSDGSDLDLSYIELFIHILVPCMYNLYEKDLTFSLHSGLSLWQPLWNHSSPLGSLLAVPIVFSDTSHDSHDGKLNLLSPKKGKCAPPLITYFDIALLKVMMLDKWSLSGYRWGLRYIQNYLETLMNYHGFDGSNNTVLGVINKLNIKRSSSPVSVNSDSRYHDVNQAEIDSHNSFVKAAEQDKNNLPEHLHEYVTEGGGLKLNCILKVINHHVVCENLQVLCGDFLFSTAQLIDLSFDTPTHFTHLKNEFDPLFHCLLHVIKMIGCEHCSTTYKGVKSEQFRALSQIYFQKLLSINSTRSNLLLVNYVKSNEVLDTVQLFHAFMSFCSKSQKAEENLANSSFDVDPLSMSNYNTYLHNKGMSERQILKWTAIILFKKITKVWPNMKSPGKIDSFVPVVQLIRYLQQHHYLILRKIVMVGILDSFDRSTTSKSPLAHDDSALELQATPPASPISISNLRLDPKGSMSRKQGKGGKKLLWFMRQNQKSLYDSDQEGSSSTLPTLPMCTSSSELKEISDNAKESPSTLPRSFLSKLHRFEQQMSFHKQKDVALPASVSGSVDSLTEKIVRKRGKMINVKKLSKGLHQLRFLSQLTVPGICPEECVVAAMLDLEAPVVARAAYLLELAYFVHQCNKDNWPSLMQFSSLYTAMKSETDISVLKRRAGVHFHRWGVTIGKKLEDILLQEKAQREASHSTQEEKHADFMYQGDISVVSQYCPHSLRYIACQLLFEITAFLRESFTEVTVQISTPAESPNVHVKSEALSSRNEGTSKKKHSITSGISRKFSAIQRRKFSGSHLAPTTGSEKTSVLSSPSKVRRKASGARVTKKRSMIQYNVPRRYSRASTFDQQASMSISDLDEHFTDFPWLNVIIQMSKATDFLCFHSRDTQCQSSCPLSQSKSSMDLFHSLNTVYECSKEDDDDIIKKSVDPVHKYLCEEVGSLSHIPFSVLCKGARVMDISQRHETMAFCWEALLYPDDRLKAAASSLFLISGVLSIQMEKTISDFVMKQLTSVDTSERAKAIQRLGTLWNYQYKVYDHLEDHEKRFLKIPLPKVDYTHPTRLIGKVPRIAPDAPWLPNAPNYQDVDLSDDEDDFYFMDSERQLEAKTKKRTKKLNDLKEGYLLTAEPFCFQAIHKVTIFNTNEEEEQTNATFMKMKEDAVSLQSDCPVLSFFPESMGQGLMQLIRLLDDTSIAPGTSHSVSGLAHHVIWKCLVDNPEVFFRRFFEKIISKQHHIELILLLRKLLIHIPVLPPHTAQMLFNHLVGVVALYERTNRPNSPDRIAPLMFLLCQIASSVPSIYFKELQLSLRRENVDNLLMVTANAPCTKEILLYPDKETLSIMEDMTFKELLTQVERNEDRNLWLVDKYSGHIMEKSYKVRDVYIHKRGFPRPVLKLEVLDWNYSFRKRQKQALTNKLMNINQLDLCRSIFDALPNKRHVMFLYSELYQKESFPGKAIDLEFDLCDGSEFGQEIFGLDVIYKDCWVKFISNLLNHLSSSCLHYGEEAIGIFIVPINGALWVHCEDVLILRTALAGLLNIVIHYEKTFALDGFQEILPTLLQVYSQYEANTMVKEAIEFTVHQFFFIHQGSFILQMFASAAPILIPENKCDEVNMVPARCLFMLLLSLDKKQVDHLDIMSLVDNGGKPLKPYGEPINEESDHSSVDLSIRLALTIISYKSESSRALQMMFVLSTLVPYYLNHLKGKADGIPGDIDLKKEMKHMRHLIKYIATIIDLYEHLRNSMQGVSASTHAVDGNSASNVHWMWTSIQNTFSSFSQWFSSRGRELGPDGDDMERASIFEEGENPIKISPSNKEKRLLLEEFCLPRTILLKLASQFAIKCTETCQSLRQTVNGGFSEIIEDENSLILIDIAISMLKLVFLDHDVLKNPGLERFLLDAMPLINWKENLEPFGVIIKRMTIIFHIIVEKPLYWRYVNWDGLENLIRGLYLTLKKQESIADIPEIKDLLHTCIKVIITDVTTHGEISVSGTTLTSSLSFNTSIVKLSARLLHTLPIEYNLKQTFGRYVRDPDSAKVDRFMMHWLLPLVIRMGTNRPDYPRISLESIQFFSSVLISILVPKEVHYDPLSFLAKFGVQLGTRTETPPSLLKICFLGFKILLTVFPNSFGQHWKEIKKTFEVYMENNTEDIALWKFISFVVTTRSPLLIHLLPNIKKKLPIAENNENLQPTCSRIKKDLLRPPVINSRSQILQKLINELSSMVLKDKEGYKSELSDEDNTPSSARRWEEQITIGEDDTSYINRVKKNIARVHSKGKDKPRQGSIMKKAEEPIDAHPKFKKQVSFQDSSSVSAKSIEHQSPELPSKVEEHPGETVSKDKLLIVSSEIPKKISGTSWRRLKFKQQLSVDEGGGSEESEEKISPTDKADLVESEVSPSNRNVVSQDLIGETMSNPTYNRMLLKRQRAFRTSVLSNTTRSPEKSPTSDTSASSEEVAQMSSTVTSSMPLLMAGKATGKDQ